MIGVRLESERITWCRRRRRAKWLDEGRVIARPGLRRMSGIGWLDVWVRCIVVVAVSIRILVLMSTAVLVEWVDRILLVLRFACNSSTPALRHNTNHKGDQSHVTHRLTAIEGGWVGHAS